MYKHEDLRFVFSIIVECKIFKTVRINLISRNTLE